MSRRGLVGPGLLLGLLAVVVIVGIGVVVGGRSSTPSAGAGTAARPRMVERDQLAPLFRLPKPSGEMLSLDEFGGHVVLVNFWATWCAPCRAEMPVLQSMYETYRDRKFTVVAVNVQETAEQVRPYVADLGLTFPVVLDRQGEVKSTYRVQALPRTFLLARDGRVVRIHPGELTTETLERYLREVL